MKSIFKKLCIILSTYIYIFGFINLCVAKNFTKLQNDEMLSILESNYKSHENDILQDFRCKKIKIGKRSKIYYHMDKTIFAFWDEKLIRGYGFNGIIFFTPVSNSRDGKIIGFLKTCFQLINLNKIQILENLSQNNSNLLPGFYLASGPYAEVKKESTKIILSIDNFVSKELDSKNPDEYYYICISYDKYATFQFSTYSINKDSGEDKKIAYEHK